MTVTVADIRAKFPAFASTDAGTVTAAIEEAERSTNRAHFGGRADDAVKYLAAHILHQDAGGAGAAAGPMTSETKGPISRSFAVSSTSSDPRASTAYGRRYLELLQTTFAGRV